MNLVSEILSAFVTQWPVIYADCLHTAYNAFAGLVLAGLLASGAYLLTVWLPQTRTAIQVLVVSTKVSPAIAYVPLFIVLFRGGMMPKICVATLLTLYPIFEQMVQRRGDLPARLTGMARALGATSIQEEIAFGWGYAVAGLSRGLVVAAPISVVGAIVGDYIVGGTRPGGIGARIVGGVNSGDPTTIVLCIGLATVLGITFYVGAKGLDTWISHRLHLSFA